MTPLNAFQFLLQTNNLLRQSKIVVPRSKTPNSVESQIKSKIQTFVKWDAEEYLRNKKQSKKVSKKTNEDQKQNILETLMRFINQMKKKEERNKSRGGSIHRDSQTSAQSARQNTTVSENQRERFKKIANPLYFIDFYAKNHRFEPNQYQKILIDHLVKIKALVESMEALHLDSILNQIYYFLNITVDLNEQRLFIITIIMIAEICFEAKDYKRSVYFYNQSKIAAVYTNLPDIIIQSLIGLARISYDLSMPNVSIKFLKKALAYAWQQNDVQSEIEIYDHFGQNFYMEGKIERAKYYHERYLGNCRQKQGSALRKIYLEIIKDDLKNKNLRLYSQNVDVLLLETLSLPVFNFTIYPQYSEDKNESIQKSLGSVDQSNERLDLQFNFKNYIDGQSPRKKVENKNFSYEFFDDPETQINRIISQEQFKKQMPNPDVQNMYQPSNRYSKKKRQVDFSQTAEFQQITGIKIQPKIQYVPAQRYSMQKKIQLIMENKPNPNWYQEISKRVKKERKEKLGSLKDAVRKSHLKTEQRKRSQSNTSQNIRSSINKAILNWIDPVQ